MDEIIQKTDAWYQARLGKLTGSKVADATSTIKTGEAASRRAYRGMLVVERLTGISQGSDLTNNKYVNWGNDAEPIARARFEAEIGCLVTEVGFVDHPTIPMAGCSPDGLLYSDSLVEFKCPAMGTHFGYLKADTVPNEYRKQIMFQLLCTGRHHAYFCSFDPRFDFNNQLLIVEWTPKQAELDALEEECVKFLAEVAIDEAWLRARGQKLKLINQPLQITNNQRKELAHVS